MTVDGQDRMPFGGCPDNTCKGLQLAVTAQGQAGIYVRKMASLRIEGRL